MNGPGEIVDEALQIGQGGSAPFLQSEMFIRRMMYIINGGGVWRGRRGGGA